MEKRHIIKFLQEKDRGVYTLIVKVYEPLIGSMGKKMALKVIKDDLEKEAGAPIDLRYSSFSKAITRFRKKRKYNPGKSGEDFQFKDAYELKNDEQRPGRFKLR